MKKLFFSFVPLLLTLTSFAQKENFGIVNYTAPAGYQLIRHDNVLSYYKEDKNTGAYCNIFIYQLVPGQGDPKSDFDNAWNNQVQKPFKFTAIPTMQPEANLKGWKFLFGNAKYNDNGIATLAILICFSGENKMQSVCILANSDSYKADIENFIGSADVSRSPSSKASTQNSNTSNGSLNNKTKSTQAASTITQNIKYDLWMCHCYTSSGNMGEKKFTTVVLSPDGRVKFFLPEKGLNGVTPDNSNQEGSWGKVTDKGNMLSLVNDKYGSMNLYKISATSMSKYPNSSSSIYKKLKQVDGLRFEGAYSPELSYYNGKTDIVSKQIDPKKRPIIFFRKDGTYINEGIEFSNLTFGDAFAIGRGTYQIVNYSLILTTQSGRTLQVAFTPLLDANPTSADNSGFMINNNLYYRLNKTFTPNN